MSNNQITSHFLIYQLKEDETYDSRRRNILSLILKLNSLKEEELETIENSESYVIDSGYLIKSTITLQELVSNLEKIINNNVDTIIIFSKYNDDMQHDLLSVYSNRNNFLDRFNSLNTFSSSPNN